MVTSQLDPATLWTVAEEVCSFAWQNYVLNWLGSILIKTLNLRTSLLRKPGWNFPASQVKRGRRFLCIKVTFFTSCVAWGYKERLRRRLGSSLRQLSRHQNTSVDKCWEVFILPSKEHPIGLRDCFRGGRRILAPGRS